MALYTHYKFGQDYPEKLAGFEEVLTKDLIKVSNEKRFAKDRAFWESILDQYGEPLYSDIQGKKVLEESRKRHNDKSLRSADIEKVNLFV